eukprot:TRINITY_DN1791_c0_g1_i1.p1 TRINITY_DN1791_c0_g1~~TRINITY_DN1791_c0_g1_i1.p1  ORF type:complete len:324 (+),score=99.40 TRINITY_DN1791_c0_g1_i1:115-1086(+)
MSYLRIPETDALRAKYNLGKELGSGTFGVVKEGIRKVDGAKFAVKCVSKRHLSMEDEISFRREVEILESLKHDGIVRLIEVFDCPKYFYMVMEKMVGGELFDRIVAKEKYTEQEAKDTIKALAEAIKYCHELGVAHRDLKPENLLYASPHSDVIKIADFGLAKLIDESKMMQTACGTPGYVAPEILIGSGYGAEVDLWSLGVIAYILLCGFPPFYDDNNAALFEKIKKAEFVFLEPYWDGVSADAKDLINKLLVVDPTERLTADKVLEHKWIVGEAREAYEMNSVLVEMRKFNARRKFRQGIHSVMALNAFQNILKTKKKSDE